MGARLADDGKQRRLFPASGPPFLRFVERLDFGNGGAPFVVDGLTISGGEP
jgi:hypothetical protein